MSKNHIQTFIAEYLLIILGSAFYAVSTVLFVFPHSLLLGGTSGFSVILNFFLPFSPSNILMIVNFSLIVVAFLVLGKSMGLKTLIGSSVTTILIGVCEKISPFVHPIIRDPYLSAIIGAATIAVSSGILFYVGSCSGGTDVIALIIQKFSKVKIGKALWLTDVLIVIAGGLLSNWTILLSSFLGLLVKTLGIDFVIAFIKKRLISSARSNK